MVGFGPNSQHQVPLAFGQCNGFFHTLLSRQRPDLLHSLHKMLRDILLPLLRYRLRMGLAKAEKEKEKESKEAIRLAPLSIMLEMKNTEIGTHRLSYPLLSQGISGSKESTSSSSNGAGLSISSSMPLSRAISFCNSHILQI